MNPTDPTETNPTKTAVVVNTYHRILNPAGIALLRKFQQQCGDQFDFFVNYDDHGHASRDSIASQLSDLSVAFYDMQDFRHQGFDKPIDRRHHWGQHQNPNYFYAHYRMMLFAQRHPDYDYYWFFDDDVDFQGNLSELFKCMLDNRDDFIATYVFGDGPEPVCGLPQVNAMDSKMFSFGMGPWLVWCPGPGDKFKSTHRHLGSFFPVVRFSQAAIKHLLKLHAEGFYGYSEGFVPTSLASDGFQVSSLLDSENRFRHCPDIDCVIHHKHVPLAWSWL